MPNDFYGGVDLMYSQGLGINAYSEPEWTSAGQMTSMPAAVGYQDPYPTPESTSRPPPIEVSSVPHHMLNIPRPKSSPSTFGPNVEDLLFTENPYKFKQDEFRHDSYPSFFPSPVPSSKSSPYFGATADFASSRTSPSRHVPIAPDPLGMRQLQSMKRMREDEEYEQTYGRKRKRTSSASGPVELNEEEQLLLKLKEEENLPWKDIATRFQTELGKTYQVPALQMRFKRLRERMRSWTEADVKALEEAHAYWEKSQFDIISAKMLEFGASTNWTPKQCSRKWEELYPQQPGTGFNRELEHEHTLLQSTPAISSSSSSCWDQQQPPSFFASGLPSSACSPPSWQLLHDPWASSHASPVESLILPTTPSEQDGTVPFFDLLAKERSVSPLQVMGSPDLLAAAT